MFLEMWIFQISLFDLHITVCRKLLPYSVIGGGIVKKDSCPPEVKRNVPQPSGH